MEERKAIPAGIMLRSAKLSR